MEKEQPVTHRGQVLEDAIRDSGKSITEIANALGYSRAHMYNLFQKENVSWDVILKTYSFIGRSPADDFNDLPWQSMHEAREPDEPREKLQKVREERDLWMRRYLELNDKYISLLESIHHDGTSGEKHRLEQ